MPLTPFHLGPGLLFKAALGRRMSLVTFTAVQGVIDAEPIWHALRNESPLHRLFHTLPGALLASAIGLGMGMVVGPPLLRWWNRKLAPGWQSRLRGDPALPWGAALNGALLGGLSHLLLDATLYIDMTTPFPGLVTGNPLLGLLTMRAAYGGCAVAGVVGLALLLRPPRRG